MAKRCCGAIRVIFLGDAEIDQHGLVTCGCQDDVGWLHVAVDDGWLLAAQDFQVRSFDIFHEQIGPITLLAVEHAIDAGKRRVMKLLEQLPFVGEPIPVLLARVNYLLDSKDLFWSMLISHAVDSSETAPTE